LQGAHHFYITFKTRFPEAKLSDALLTQYPEEMTVVLEHQFWDLEVEEERFAVTLSFQGRPERVSIPFEAITSFTDPSVKFGLQFQPGDNLMPPAPTPPSPGDAKKKADNKAAKTGEVVTLDSFRKK
jgi:uncharacterized protein